MQEHFDTLITVLSGSPEQPNMSVLHTSTSFTPVTPVTPVPPVPMLSVPDLDSLTTFPFESPDDDNIIFQLQLPSTSERNFAVQLLQHIFKPIELAGCNVRGVRGKLPLNPEKIFEIKEMAFRLFLPPYHSRNFDGATAEKESTPIYVIGKYVILLNFCGS